MTVRRAFARTLTPQFCRFVLERIDDETGLSGTGIVAWGVQFPDGKVTTRWAGQTTDVRQTCVWDSIDHVRTVHGHNGKTRIVWLDQEPNT